MFATPLALIPLFDFPAPYRDFQSFQMRLSMRVGLALFSRREAASLRKGRVSSASTWHQGLRERTFPFRTPSYLLQPSLPSCCSSGIQSLPRGLFCSSFLPSLRFPFHLALHQILPSIVFRFPCRNSPISLLTVISRVSAQLPARHCMSIIWIFAKCAYTIHTRSQRLRSFLSTLCLSYFPALFC